MSQPGGIPWVTVDDTINADVATIELVKVWAAKRQERVQIFGPALYHRNPVRRLTRGCQQLLSALESAPDGEAIVLPEEQSDTPIIIVDRPDYA